MDGEMLEQNLKCPICFNIVEEPLESSCCGHLFCKGCVKSLNKSGNCPICRSNKVNYRENTFVRVLLDSLMVKCPNGCEIQIPISNVKYHRYQCTASKFVCSITINGVKCNFEGTKTDSLKHFAEAHADQMVILAEHFSNMKATYDKHSMFEKLNKMAQKERLEKEQKEKDEDEYNESYFNEILSSTPKLEGEKRLNTIKDGSSSDNANNGNKINSLQEKNKVSNQTVNSLIPSLNFEKIPKKK